MLVPTPISLIVTRACYRVRVGLWLSLLLAFLWAELVFIAWMRGV